MDEAKALSIVSALANGVNPVTGEVFEPDSPYQAPEIVRALYLACRALDAGTRPQRPRGPLPGNAGKPWTEDEDRRLLAEFDRGRPIAELMQTHGRTLAGIEARLERHGRLAPQQRVTKNRGGSPDGGSRDAHGQNANGGRHVPR